MRRAWVLALMLAAAPACAQAPAPERPALRESATPEARFRDGKVDRVETMRRGGELLMVVVTPPGGRPYYLIDGPSWLRREALDPGLRVPLWPVVSLD
jgi:hypothetical protein